MSILATYEGAAQLSVSYLQGQATFAEVSYEFDERWEPALRVYPSGLLENTAIGVGVTYDVYEREAAEVFIGAGVGFARAFEQDAVLVPVGLSVRPFAERRFAVRAELDAYFADLREVDTGLLGSLGVQWRFAKDD